MPTDREHQFIDALSMPAFLVGADKRIGAANSPAREIFGERMEGRHYISALRHPTLLDCIETAIRLRETSVANYLARVAGRDATWRVTAAVVDATLPDTPYLVTFEDRSALQEAGQIRRDFVANVSHELRTPLTSLLGFIETLRGPAREDSEARDRFLEIMEREAARMNRLIDDLLSLSRVEAEERMQPRERVRLEDAVTVAMTAMRPIAEEAGVTLAPEISLAGADVQGDSDQLVQVATNLIENAIKYGARGGRVSIRIAVADGEYALRGPAVRLIVSDDGRGIDPVHIPRLTERFYRADNHRSREMGGTGLGLAIVKHIVNRHRGRLRIESEIGRGTDVSVILPRF